ncbi:MAG: poly(A) polymerase [Myxococcales bacterium]
MSKTDRTLHDKAAAVARRLSQAGHEAYFAGGCVRDMLLGVAPKDYDIATSATAEQVRATFSRTVPIGAAFGVMQVHYAGAAFEVATFRTEHGYSDGRRPDRVEHATAREDVLRRDFTINGLLYDPERGAVIDWVGGQEDLAARVIRAVGRPEERFAEDRLRMLRAVRFAARLGFDIEAGTAEAITRLAPEVRSVSAERIREELLRTLSEGGAAAGARLLRSLGLRDAVLPEARGTLEHEARVLDRLPPGDGVLGLAVLLHRGTGAEAEAAGRRLRLSNAETVRLRALVAGRALADEMPSPDAAKLKRFLRHEHARALLALWRADAEDGHGDLVAVSRCEAALAAFSAEELCPPRLLTGDDLMALGYRAGPSFRPALEALEDAQLRGEVATREEAEALMAARLGAPQ